MHIDDVVVAAVAAVVVVVLRQNVLLNSGWRHWKRKQTSAQNKQFSIEELRFKSKDCDKIISNKW